MRTQIAKALQTRCQAIRRAVSAYNTAAARMNPPRDPLDWAKVSNYGFIEEFVMLRNTRNDIAEKPWVKPVFREMLKMRHRIARANEEMTRCNVEIRRVYTAVCDEHIMFSQVLRGLESTNDLLYGPLLDFVTRRKAVNRALLKRVEDVHSLHGFTGDRTRGVKLGSNVIISDQQPGVVALGLGGDGTDDDNEDDDVPAEEDEAVQMDIRGVEVFMTNLS